MDERFEGRLIGERQNQVTIALSIAWFAITIPITPVFYLQLLSQHVLAGVGVGWFVASFALVALMSRFAKKPRRSTVDVQIDEEGIHVDGKRVVQRRHIRSGAMHTGADGAIRVVFRRSFAGAFGGVPVLALFATDAAQARAMLAAAGVDAERQVFRASFLRPQGAWQVVLATVLYAALSACFFAISWRIFGFVDNPALAVIPVLIGGLLAYGLYALMVHTTVSVGTDGIEIRRAFRKRFLQLDQIRDVKVEPKALRIVLASGEIISLAGAVPVERGHIGGQLGLSAIEMERALLGERIVDAVRTHKLGRPDGAGVVALGRDSRSAGEWLASLRAVGMCATDYRTNAMPLDELRRVVSDATAASDVRVGAAVALRVAEGGVGVERIRIAAETTAAPELRGVLKDIADEADEDNLQRHLSRVR